MVLLNFLKWIRCCTLIWLMKPRHLFFFYGKPKYVIVFSAFFLIIEKRFGDTDYFEKILQLGNED